MGLRDHACIGFQYKTLCVRGKELAGNAWGLGFTFTSNALCVKGEELAGNAWGLGFTFAEGFQPTLYA